jgi:hypothetical protein
MFALGGGGYGGHDEYPLITPTVSFEFTVLACFCLRQNIADAYARGEG